MPSAKMAVYIVLLAAGTMIALEKFRERAGDSSPLRRA